MQKYHHKGAFYTVRALSVSLLLLLILFSLRRTPTSSKSTTTPLLPPPPSEIWPPFLKPCRSGISVKLVRASIRIWRPRIRARETRDGGRNLLERREGEREEKDALLVVDLMYVYRLKSLGEARSLRLDCNSSNATALNSPPEDHQARTVRRWRADHLASGTEDGVLDLLLVGTRGGMIVQEIGMLDRRRLGRGTTGIGWITAAEGDGTRGIGTEVRGIEGTIGIGGTIDMAREGGIGMRGRGGVAGAGVGVRRRGGGRRIGKGRRRGGGWIELCISSCVA